MPSAAYLLVSHGSRDPRPQVAIERLAWLLRERLEDDVKPAPKGPAGQLETLLNEVGDRLPFKRSRPLAPTHPHSNWAPLVGTATLELAHLPLHQQIQQFANRAIAIGYSHLRILPLFLLPGVHVMEDIPTEVELAQQAIGSAMQIDLYSYLGSHPQVKSLLASQSKSATAGRILISHGSRRPGGNQPVEAIATELEAALAYWSVPPSLGSQVTTLIQAGHHEIEILPYFLFVGGITDAIAQAVADIAQQYPDTHLHLAQPLGVSDEMADLILDLLRQPIRSS